MTGFAITYHHWSPPLTRATFYYCCNQPLFTSRHPVVQTLSLHRSNRSGNKLSDLIGLTDRRIAPKGAEKSTCVTPLSGAPHLCSTPKLFHHIVLTSFVSSSTRSDKTRTYLRLVAQEGKESRFALDLRKLQHTPLRRATG
jgi:hypothetical protein